MSGDYKNIIEKKSLTHNLIKKTILYATVLNTLHST